MSESGYSRDQTKEEAKESGEEDKRSSWNKLQDWRSKNQKLLGSDNLLQSVAVFGLILYSLGLLVVNDYLFQIGVTDFAVVRVQFIVTGLLTLGFLMVPIFVAGLVVTGVEYFYFGARYVKRHRNFGILAKTKDPMTEGPLTALIMLVLCLSAAAIPLLTISRNFDLHSAMLDSGGFKTFGTVAYGAFLALFLRAKLKPAHGHYSRVRSGMAAVTILFACLFTVAFLLDVVASSIYPGIPSQLGGGKPRPVELVVSIENAARLNQLFPDYFGADGVSQPLDLLWETDSYFVVRERGDEDARIAQVNKDEVLFVVGEPRYLRNRDEKPTPEPTTAPNPSLVPASPSPDTHQ